MPKPSGPAPASTTTSSNWISPRFTAWAEQAYGSIRVAFSIARSCGTRWVRASLGKRIYFAMPPLTLLWKPYTSCRSHTQYSPRLQ